MRAVQSAYFQPNPLRKDARTILVLLAVILAAAGGVLLLQSVVYASSLADLLETGHNLWWPSLAAMLRTLATWAVVLGTVFAIRFVNQPGSRHGWRFWIALFSGLLLGLALSYLIVFAAGLGIYLPFGLLSLLFTEIYPLATLQFGWLVATYLVFLWFAVGIPPLLSATYFEGRWYFKVLVVVLFFALFLDVLQTSVSALRLVAQNSVWQTSGEAFWLAIFGTLIVTMLAVIWPLRGRSRLTAAYTIAGIYLASIITGNLSALLFQWGELPSALLACLAPLAYVQAAKWILHKWDPRLPDSVSAPP